MAQLTQLDSLESGCNGYDDYFEMGSPGDDVIVVESDNAEPEPSPSGLKKRKLEIGPRDCSRDGIKWIPCPATGNLIPFVKNAETQVVHAGKSQMEVIPCQTVTLVQCLSGCEPKGKLECGGLSAGCSCLCHLLRAYYAEKYAH